MIRSKKTLPSLRSVDPPGLEVPVHHLAQLGLEFRARKTDAGNPVNLLNFKQMKRESRCQIFRLISLTA